MVFRTTVLGLLLVGAAGCSSSVMSGPIEFVHTFDGPSETSVWVATGEAIDEGLLCPSATGLLDALEDENGNVRTPEELDELRRGSTAFVSVAVEDMVCDDSSGNFALRITSQIDPDSAGGVDSTTWSIVGGAEYGGITGSGDTGSLQVQGGTTVLTGAGTMTTG